MQNNIINVNHTKTYGKSAYYSIWIADINRSRHIFAFDPAKSDEHNSISVDPVVKHGFSAPCVMMPDNEVCVSVSNICFLNQQAMSNLKLRKALLTIIEKLEAKFDKDTKLLFFYLDEFDKWLVDNGKDIKEAANESNTFINKENLISIAELSETAEQLKKPTYEGQENDIFRLEMKTSLVKDFFRSMFMTIPSILSNPLEVLLSKLRKGAFDEFINGSDPTETFYRKMYLLIDNMFIYDYVKKEREDAHIKLDEYIKSDEFKKLIDVMITLKEIGMDVKSMFSNKFAYDLILKNGK